MSVCRRSVEASVEKRSAGNSVDHVAVAKNVIANNCNVISGSLPLQINRVGRNCRSFKVVRFGGSNPFWRRDVERIGVGFVSTKIKRLNNVSVVSKWGKVKITI
ncbi:hypothetical protein D9M71_756060 [compost metagenome]